MAGFHDSRITYLRELLQPPLRPRFAAVTQDRLCVVESDRPIRPDISVVDVPGGHREATTRPAAGPTDEPVVLELYEEEIRQPVLHFVERAGNRLVTAIEVLSPDNKAPGRGRDSYLDKRSEL